MRRIAQTNNACARRTCYKRNTPITNVGDCWIQRCIWVFCVITLLLFTTGKVAFAVPPGTVISNTAAANFSVSGVPQNRPSNVVDIITTTNLTPAAISFLQYSPTGLSATPENSSPTGCSTTGLAGPFPPLGNPTYLGLGTLNAAAPLDLVSATTYHQGEPIFIRVVDLNRNVDNGVRDTLVITIRSSNLGDEEILELSETTINSGEFIGYVQSVTTPVIQYDCQLAVSTQDTIEVSYTDVFDNTDVVSTNILVDPFGIVFDSSTGNPINGISVTLVNAVTGLPAAVFGDDLVSTFPSTVVTGGTVTDSGSTVYNFSSGEYRFPSVAPGTYRLEVTAGNYVVPSAVSEQQLQTLSGAPYALDSNASFRRDFVLVIGPPLNVDIPIDPISDVLFVAKQASKQEVSIGDFLQYEISVTNNRPLQDAAGVVLVDTLPTGFRYQPGSVQIDGVDTSDPEVDSDGRTMTFSLGTISAASSATIKYVVEVTAGAVYGSATNSALASDDSGISSNVAQAVVLVGDDLLSTRSFLIGTVAQGACEDEKNISEGEIEYQLTSEIHDTVINHIVDIDNPSEISGPLLLEVNVPKFLQYKRSSVKVNGKDVGDPRLENNKLYFELKGINAKQLSVQFSTHADLSMVGEYEIKARITISNDKNIKIKNTWAYNKFSIAERKSHKRGLLELTKHVSEVRKLNITDINPYQGIAGVRLFLEDGRYVITDDRGMYHFEGIEPGTHVVQLDPSTIPENLEIYECVENTRTAGAKYSQFVDIAPGLLWRSNFYLREKAPTYGTLTTNMSSVLKDGVINYTVNINGEKLSIQNVRASVILPEGLQYIEASSILNDGNTNGPKNAFGTLIYSLNDQQGDAWHQQIKFKVKGVPAYQGQVNTKVLVTYDNGDLKNQRAVPIDNSIFFQEQKKNVKYFNLHPTFSTLSAKLNNQDIVKLDELIKELRAYEVVGIRVIGHTDNLPISGRSKKYFPVILICQ